MENDETEKERDASLPFFNRLEGNYIFYYYYHN